MQAINDWLENEFGTFLNYVFAFPKHDSLISPNGN